MVDTKHPPAAIEQAGLFSYITFNWIQPLLLYGRKHTLTENDLQRLSENDRIERLSDLIIKEWTYEVNEKKTQAQATGHKMKEPDLLKVLRRCFGIYALAPCAVGVCESVCKIGEAVLLGYVIRFFDTPLMTMGQGMGYAVGLFLITVVRGTLHHHNYFHTLRIGTWTRQSLISLLYRKCLTLSTSSSISTGTVVNIISNDVQPFEDCASQVMFLVLGPLESIVVMYFLWKELEEACLAGLLALVLLLPIQAVFSRKFATVRSKTVHARDERIRTLSDVFLGIELVKLCAWEVPFQEKVMMLRSIEVRHIWTANSMRAVNLSIYFFFQPLIALFAFVTFWLQGKALTPDKVFVSLTLFNIIRQTMTSFFPKALETSAEARVSCKRITEFLLLPELKSLEDEEEEEDEIEGTGLTMLQEDSQSTVGFDQGMSKDRQDLPDIVVEMKDASFSWTIATEEKNEILEMSAKERKKKAEEERQKQRKKVAVGPLPELCAVEELGVLDSDSSKKAILKNISMTLRRTELLAIVGPVGCGKSSFCMALLKEMPLISGSMVQASHQGRRLGSKSRPLTMSYSAQSPWIFAGTIRTNILFGSKFNQERYDRVIRACELTRDLSLLPQGDGTLIGEKGVTLSGGQRARVSLARAAYRESDLYILDDPLSAVDPKVGRALFENCINGLLKDKARILVTHQLQYIKDCENVIVLERGQVTHAGRVDDVMQEEVEVETTIGDRASARSIITRAKFVDVLREFAKKVPDATEETESVVVTSEAIEPVPDTALLDAQVTDPTTDDRASVMEKNLTTEEVQEGETSMKAYVEFFRMGSPWAKLILTVFCLSAAQAISVGGDFFLTRWSGQYDETEQRRSYYPTAFGMYVLGTMIMTMIRSYLFFDCATSSSRNMFAAMLDSLMRTGMDFFHANPHGRVLNRFSKDMAICDEMLPNVFFDTIQVGFMLLGSIVTVCIVNPWIIIAIPFIMAGFIALRAVYIKSSRQVKRIDSQSRSPIYSHLSETLDGLSSVRAFGVSGKFMKEQIKTQEDNGRAFFTYLAMARWLGYRLDAVSAVFLGLTAISCVGLRDSQQAARAGLAMSSIIGLSGELQWAIRMSVEAAILMVSVERMMEYANVKPEESGRHLFNPDGSSVVPNGWPMEAKVTFTDMSLTYPRGDGPVLKHISLDFKAGEKIAIVGRTGAGKSSLIGAIFRLVETTTGNPAHRGGISIDGIDISKIGMHDLRSKMAIIPQEPFLFRGTLRFNLDPTDQHQDADIWSALEAAEIKRLVESLEGGLDAVVDDNGKNFSIGERQLLSLARAVLRRSKIIVMDEATANVDLQSDRMIQKAIHNQFEDATVFTIAHRLNTVIEGYDRILVLDQGEVMEFDDPWVLLDCPPGEVRPAEGLGATGPTPGGGRGWLRKMVADTGPENEAMLRQVAKEQWERRNPTK